MAEKMIAVCIVEDQKNIRESLEILVSNEADLICLGCFENGQKAVDAIPNLMPDLVLMDIDMPVLNGIDAIKQLKSQCPSMQFMVCTVYDEDAKVFEALKAGATSYILKRSSGKEITNAIRDLHAGGSPMSSDIARKIVLSFQASTANQQEIYSITKREKEILELLAKGMSYQEIADHIFISSKTLKKHIYNIYEKLHVNSKVEAINKFFGRQF
jgi:two-component system, NarL family, response regulator LiaR